MTLINFSHPITEEQKAQIEAATGHTVQQILHIPAQFDHNAPFDQQAEALVDSVGLSKSEWQTTPIIVNLPSLAVIAAATLAELHGRMGYFPAVLRLRPVPNSMPPKFEVAEIINLQAVRDAARSKR
ncbi:MAG: hypothetical protein KIT45_04400 [Fimbriimonadia bacterium]|nr:hypothetical protein [Fimbriimonadia bacterium]